MQDTIPWTHPSPQIKQHLYPFSRLNTDNSRMYLYLTMEGPFFPKNLSFPMGDLNPHVIHGPLGPPKSSTQNGISIGSAVFAGLTSVTDRQTTLLGL